MIVLIRVDATPEVGAGHLMRMIALGQILVDAGHEVHMLTATVRSALPPATRELTIHAVAEDVRIGSSDDARDLVTLARRLGARWIVLDGDHFETSYQRLARSAGSLLMSVADLAAHHFVSDVLLDQNYGAERTPYSTEAYTTRYLGTGYLMLRREFRVATPRRRRAEPLRAILVTLGGGAAAAIDALVRLAPVLERVDADGIRFRVVTGMLAAVPEAVATLARSRPDRFDVVRQVERMAEEMDAADAAVCSGGTTVWELMCMRVPIVAVSVNASQAAFLAALERDGLCVHLGPHAGLTAAEAIRIDAFIADARLRARMVGAGTRLVDPRRSSDAVLRIFSSR